MIFAHRPPAIVYIRKSKKDRFYTCIFIENGLRKALRTYIFMKKSVFVCTFHADRGKIGRNAHINSTKKPFSYVRPPQTGMPQRSQQRPPLTAQRSNGHPGAYPRHSPCKKGRPCEQATLSAVMRIQSMMIAKLFGVALAFHGAVAAAAGARAFALFFGPDQTSDGQSDYRYEAKRYDDRSHVFSEPG